MGKLADLCGEIAAEAEEGSRGFSLPASVWDRLRADWAEDEIEDALDLVHANLLQNEIVEAADSLSARMVEFLGTFGDAQSFTQASRDEGRIPFDTLIGLARRIDNLEERLQVIRAGSPVNRAAFDALLERLANAGIEEQMREPQVEES
jgi:hypothetical protein